MNKYERNKKEGTREKKNEEGREGSNSKKREINSIMNTDRYSSIVF